jgi:hypothetical protein
MTFVDIILENLRIDDEWNRRLKMGKIEIKNCDTCKFEIDCQTTWRPCTYLLKSTIPSTVLTDEEIKTKIAEILRVAYKAKSYTVSGVNGTDVSIWKGASIYTYSEIAKVLKEIAVPITVSVTSADMIGHEVYLIKKDEFDRLIAELKGVKA